MVTLWGEPLKPPFPQAPLQWKMPSRKVGSDFPLSHRQEPLEVIRRGRWVVQACLTLRTMEDTVLRAAAPSFTSPEEEGAPFHA